MVSERPIRIPQRESDQILVSFISKVLHNTDREGVLEPMESFMPRGVLFSTEDAIPGLKLQSKIGVKRNFLLPEYLNLPTTIISRDQIKPLYFKRPVILFDNGCKEDHYIASIALRILKQHHINLPSFTAANSLSLAGILDNPILDNFKIEVMERRLNVYLHNTWKQVGHTASVLMSKPKRTETTGQWKYVAGGDLCLQEYIMDKGLGLVFNFTIKVRVESPSDVSHESIIVT